MNLNMVSTWTLVNSDKKDLTFIEVNSDKEEVVRNIYLNRTLCQKILKIYTTFSNSRFTFSNVRWV